MNIEEQRFWAKVKQREPDACWFWQAARDRLGRGRVRFAGRTQAAYRVAFFLINPSVDRTLHVLHSCDNPACCNPKHLFAGTHTDNMQDKLKKGRPNGGGPPRVLEGTVVAVKRLKALGYSWKAITESTGASAVTIHRILRGHYDNAQN